MRAVVLAVLVVPLLSGCLARVAADVVTAPIKVASKTVDLATTSQSEADEKRGRLLRQRDERIGKLSRKRDKLTRDCPASEQACADIQTLEAQIEAEQNRPF